MVVDLLGRMGYIIQQDWEKGGFIMRKVISVILLCSLIAASGCSGAVTETTVTTESSQTSEASQTTTESTTAATTEETWEITTETTEEETEEETEEDPVEDPGEEDPVYEALDKLPMEDAAKGFDKLEDSSKITGDLLGVNVTGDTIYGLFSKKVSLSEKTVKSFKVGDSIGYKDTDAVGSPDLKVAKISKDGKHLMIELATSDDPEDYCEWSIFWNDNTDCYEITGSSDIVYAEKIGYMAVAIAPDCKVTDSYEWFTEDEVKEAYKTAEKTGNPLFDTFYWFSSLYNSEDADQTYKLRNNGWYAADSFFDATIKNGKIVKLHFWTT